MPARVDDKLINEAADALMKAAMSLTSERGLKINSGMTHKKACGHILGALVTELGYPHSIMPTGWVEMNMPLPRDE